MKNLYLALLHDEAGFVVSSELVLVTTICVLGLIVGLSEMAIGVNEELEDVGSAVGSLNQTYEYALPHGAKGCGTGSAFYDGFDEGDSQYDVSCNGIARAEY